MTAAPQSSPPANPEQTRRSRTRKKALTRLAVVVLLAGLGWGLYTYKVSSHFEDTDNAYVQGDVIQITPQLGGTVTAVSVSETDFVKADQTLVQLDPADADVALDQAQAALALAVRQARTLYANDATLTAQIGGREADVTRARSALERSLGDLQRRQSLSGDGAVSQEEIKHAQEQVDGAKSTLVAAQAAVLTARQQLASNQVMTEGTRVQQQPGVQVAAARLREAFLATQRTALRSPVDGYVAKRTVQVGQRVAAGMPLMSVVALKHLWVEANFKEVQLRNIRIGQPVTLVADQYGKKVVFSGSVTGLGVGTGAAFALLPAQNATGNWIKVVQRVPVRIALDPAQLAEHPLRVGLSMTVEVDISNTSGQALADRPDPITASPRALAHDAGADQLVQRVIAANLGKVGSGAAH